MRSIKLFPALAAAAGLLALVPAGASARAAGHRQANRLAASKSNKCLSIEVPTIITAGEPVSVVVKITCSPNASASGVPVTIYAHRAHPRKSGSTTIAGTPATTAGVASVNTNPTENTVYYAVANGMRSPQKLVKVSPAVIFEGPTVSQLSTGSAGPHGRAVNQATFTGHVSPFEKGQIVALQRENSTNNEEWRRIDLGVVNAQGVYTIKHTFGVPGDATLRVVARPTLSNAPGASSPLSYVISQRQNPRLEIHGTPDPIIYGQSVTISGVVAGAAAKQPLTLLARTHGAPFTTVAKGETESGGNYKFTQSPTQNTEYMVSSATAKSAVLFEGVKYLISATPAASTVQVGQPLTVTGKVTPGHVGQVVYLERQNASKIGFHVVEVGTVSAVNPTTKEGTFTITHAFVGAGPAALRVVAAGDPENQGVASSLFNVEVMPLPPGTLRPLRPSKLPGDGQL
jgi:hypothetical protein